MTWESYIMPALAAAAVAVAAFALRAQSRQIAREEAEKAAEAKAEETSSLLREVIRAELATFRAELPGTLNGMYPRTKLVEAEFRTVRQEIAGLRDVIQIRPCIAHGRHRADE